MEWLQSFIDGGNSGAMQLVIMTLALVAVIALVVWLFRWLAGFSTKRANRGGKPRLSVVDVAAVDDKRHLVLVRRDNTEHLVMVGGGSDVLIEAGIEIASAVSNQDQAESDAAPAATNAQAPEPSDTAVPQTAAVATTAAVAVSATNANEDEQPEAETSSDMFSSDADGIRDVLLEQNETNENLQNSTHMHSTENDRETARFPTVSASSETMSTDDRHDTGSFPETRVPGTTAPASETPNVSEEPSPSAPSIDDILDQLRRADTSK